jgi:ankyrin repeat protein
MHAAQSGKVVMVQQLLDAKADVRLKNYMENYMGDSALSLATEEGHDAVVQLLQAAAHEKNPAS